MYMLYSGKINAYAKKYSQDQENDWLPKLRRKRHNKDQRLGNCLTELVALFYE